MALTDTSETRKVTILYPGSAYNFFQAVHISETLRKASSYTVLCVDPEISVEEASGFLERHNKKYTLHNNKITTEHIVLYIIPTTLQHFLKEWNDTVDIYFERAFALFRDQKTTQNILTLKPKWIVSDKEVFPKYHQVQQSAGGFYGDFLIQRRISVEAPEDVA